MVNYLLENLSRTLCNFEKISLFLSLL